MHNFNKMIEDIGTTSTGHSGMHTNISLKNEKFTKQNFNAVKLIALADNTLMHELFPVRGYVADMLSARLTQDMVFALAGADSRDLLRQFALTIGTDKSQGINMGHMDAEVETRRIEFRYTGGKDYSKRGKTLEWAVYRFAYVLEAAFNENFMEKEYRRNVLKLLDEKTQFFFKNLRIRKFDDLRKYRKQRTSIDSVDSFITAWVNGDIKK
jgi:hypothetical protein